MLTNTLSKKQLFLEYLLYIYVRYNKEEKEQRIMLAKSGQAFGTMIKPQRRRRKSVEEFKYLENKDRRMRFNNSQDPIYYVFDCIENRPVSVLAREFVKDSFLEVANFISKVAG